MARAAVAAGRRRTDHRGAPRSARGALGRCAEPLSRRVRAPDEPVRPHRRGDRTVAGRDGGRLCRDLGPSRSGGRRPGGGSRERQEGRPGRLRGKGSRRGPRSKGRLGGGSPRRSGRRRAPRRPGLAHPCAQLPRGLQGDRHRCRARRRGGLRRGQDPVHRHRRLAAGAHRPGKAAFRFWPPPAGGFTSAASREPPTASTPSRCTSGPKGSGSSTSPMRGGPFEWPAPGSSADCWSHSLIRLGLSGTFARAPGPRVRHA